MALEKEIFENNKIKEALCQFRFEESIDTSKFNLFFEELKKGGVYVEKQDIPMLHVSFNISEATPTQIAFNGLKISSSSNDKVIQIFSDNLSIHQVGSYTTWEDYKEDIFTVFTVFNKIFNCSITRIDLRTINDFEFDINEDLKNYFNIFLTSPSCVVQPYNFNLSIEQTYEANTKFGVIRLNGYNQDEKQKVVFDLSYVLICTDDKIKVNDLNNLKDSLQFGHERLSELFKSSITDKTKNIIK